MFTWSIFNESTLTYVVEPGAPMTEDAARADAADFLLAEARGEEDADTIAMLDAAATEVLVTGGARIGGDFEWSVSVDNEE